VPNFSALNVITQVAHGVPVPGKLVLMNSLYVLIYAGAITSASVLIFERRNLK
jgi:ABC-type transport system involved in multi-copper enzyme maturation permease subunit